MVLHLIVRGLPYRFPNVNYVIPHFGGLIPMQLQRLDNQLAPQHPTLPEKPSETALRLYYDTVGHGSQAALHCGWQAFGPQHLVTGSDYPFLMDYEPYSETFAYIARSDLPPEDIEHIMQRSAADLFGSRLVAV
jgi:predicted TIM-barrel fold metal-dependent hydrolase